MRVVAALIDCCAGCHFSRFRYSDMRRGAVSSARTVPARCAPLSREKARLVWRRAALICANAVERIRRYRGAALLPTRDAACRARRALPCLL